DSYHVAEHHGTPLGLAPSPNVYLAAVSQRVAATGSDAALPHLRLLVAFHRAPQPGAETLRTSGIWGRSASLREKGPSSRLSALSLRRTGVAPSGRSVPNRSIQAASSARSAFSAAARTAPAIPQSRRRSGRVWAPPRPPRFHPGRCSAPARRGASPSTAAPRRAQPPPRSTPPWPSDHGRLGGVNLEGSGVPLKAHSPGAHGNTHSLTPPLPCVSQLQCVPRKRKGAPASRRRAFLPSFVSLFC